MASLIAREDLETLERRINQIVASTLREAKRITNASQLEVTIDAGTAIIISILKDYLSSRT